MNEQAMAWANFRDSEECQRLADPTGLGAEARQRPYIENRLWKAFNAGYKAGKADEYGRVLQRFIDVLGPNS